MSVSKISPASGIDISIDAIASIVGNAITECYGVVGLSAKKSLKDNIDTLLGKENFQKGIDCSKEKKTNNYIINVHIIVACDTKITEVVIEVQKKVKYVLEQTFGIKFNKVNIYVEGIKEIN